MNHPGETVLLVEDDENDAMFVRRAFTRAGISNPLQWVTNGEKAVAYLTAAPQFADRQQYPFPALILSDLKMPQMDGLQFLSWIREHPQTKAPPVVVLTSSTAQSDVDEAFRRGAAGYMVKPIEIRELDRIVQAIADYWRLSLHPSRTS